MQHGSEQLNVAKWIHGVLTCGATACEERLERLRSEMEHPVRRGLLPDQAKRRRAARLRARGLTLAEIGRRLGVSRQGAAHLVQAHAA